MAGGIAALVFFFSVDSDILLHGVSLFGSKDNSFLVTLSLSSTASFPVFSRSTEGTLSSMPNTLGEHIYGFDVLFEESVSLKEGVILSLKADISGPDSWYGTEGLRTHQCSGVTLTLKDTYTLAEGRTGTSRGQFNEFIFSFSQ